MRRDFLIQISYRLEFVLSGLGIFLSIAIFYFISKLFGQSSVAYLEDYCGNYFPFVFIGIAFSGYLTVALHSFSANLRKEQMMGTLEAMLVTPTKLSVIIASISIWNFVFNSISVFIYLLYGIFVFKVNLTGANLSAAALILILTIISFSGIGIISAAFIMLFKKGDPVVWLIQLASILFGGVYFPIAVLPDNLRFISYFLPITYSLRALRQALLMGQGLEVILPDITALFIFSAILLPLSIAIFKFSVHRAKIAGTLAHY